MIIWIKFRKKTFPQNPILRKKCYILSQYIYYNIYEAYICLSPSTWLNHTPTFKIDQVIDECFRHVTEMFLKVSYLFY